MNDPHNHYDQPNAPPVLGAPLVQADVVVSAQSSDVIPLLEETLEVSKRQVLTGTVRISTRTKIYEDIAELTLNHQTTEVVRVPIGRPVDAVPDVRTEGDTTIVPVIEERFVVVKQLYLKEELHIRRHVQQELLKTPVQLRRQTAIVERLDADGRVVLSDATLPL